MKAKIIKSSHSMQYRYSYQQHVILVSMSPWVLWFCVVLLIGSGVAADIPFVFDKTILDASNYTTAQLEQAHISSPNLSGVPIVTQVNDDEVIAFPVTGGGNAPEGTTEKRVGELKKAFDAAVEPDNSRVRDEAVVLALKYPGEKTIEQIASIYNYLKNGDGSKKGWGYVSDPRGIDYFMFANQTLKNGDRANCVGGGDCDDFAILMSALVESVGGTTRIILARNSSIGGHAYTEVYLGNLSEQNNQVEGIIDWLKEKYDTDKIYTHIDTGTKEVWLNLDWGPDEKGNTHPGGPFYQGDKHIVLCIREKYGKTPLRLPEKSNKPPKLIRLTSDKASPQDTGTAVNWTAEAEDYENDEILYRFFRNDDPVTKWTKENKWVWTTTEDDLGDSRIEVQVRDGKHAGLEKCDSNKVASFIINVPKQAPVAATKVANQPPSLTSLTANKASLQEAGSVVTWTVVSSDLENDLLQFQFSLDGQVMQDWSNSPIWSWTVASEQVGQHVIEAKVRDGKHNPEGDNARSANLEIGGEANRPPALYSLAADKECPHEAGTDITWTAEAGDPENDPISFRFLLNGIPVTSWSSDQQWLWQPTMVNMGESQIEVQIRDGFHAGIDGFDDSKAVSCSVTSNQEPVNESSEYWIDKGDTITSQSYNPQAYKEGILAYQKAIEIDPSSAVAWYKRGCALYFLGGVGKDSYWGGFPWGNPEELTSEAIQACNDAIECVDRAIAINQRWAVAWQFKGMVFTQLGKFDDALEFFDKAIEIDPQDPNPWGGKALALQKLGRNAEADFAVSKEKELEGT